MAIDYRLTSVLVVALVAWMQVSALELEVLQGPLYKVPADSDHPLTVRFTYNDSDPEDHSDVARILDEDMAVLVTVRPGEDWQLQFKNQSILFSAQEIADSTNKSFVFSAYYWGYFPVYFYGTNDTTKRTPVTPASSTDGGTEPINYEDLYGPLLNNGTTVVIDRKPSSQIEDRIVVGTAIGLMLINTVNMGCQLDLLIIWNVLKRPVGPLCGALSQFLCMPIFSFCTGYLLLDDPLQRLGLFTLGCSPGGNVSNFWTLLFHGDINLSITMTFCSTIIAMGMMPFWMAVLGSKLVGDSKIKVPYLNLMSSLVMLTIPIAIGLLIKYKKKSWAEKSAKIVKPMTFFMIAFFLVAGFYNCWKSLGLMTWNIVVAGLLVSAGGYTAGALMSLAFCLKKKQIIAISIETAFQNAAVAFILLKLSLPTPDNDLAAVPVLAQMLQTGPPLMVLYLIWQAVQRLFGACKIGSEAGDEEAQVPDEKEKKEKKSSKKFQLSKKEEANLSQDTADASKELMSQENGVEELEVPRTPGLLYDPSLPENQQGQSTKPF